MRNQIKILLCLSVLFFSIACGSMQIDQDEINSYTLDLPKEPDSYIMGNNEGTLGRVLFYDKSLSINNATSCGSCHIQSFAFSDGQQFSKGFQNELTTRNTPPIQNLENSFVVFPENGDQVGTLFWDGRASSLHSMVLMPILHPEEMGFYKKDQLLERVKSRPYYKELFFKAYGSEEITLDRVANALASFVASISTKPSEDIFTKSNQSDALRGEELFVSIYKCDFCHRISDPEGYLFGGSEFNGFSDIGLDQSSKDKGLGNITGNASDVGKFKIPSLRNVELTAPYMHDGRFKTLEEVIEHYSIGIKDASNLDRSLREESGFPKRLKISSKDASDIVAFLKTFTDYDMITAKKFSDPFIVK